MSRIVETINADFLIAVETVSPLLQIEPTKDKDMLTKASMVKTKKMNYVNENGKLSSEPFFSANGFRGIARRNITDTIFSTLERKDGLKMSVDTVHLYSSGGGTSANGFVNIFDKKLNYVEKEEFRNNNPFISVFGAGLSDIDGKLCVCDIKPIHKDAKLVDYLYGVRFDETERSSILTPLLDAQSVEEYKQSLELKRKENAGIRKKETEIEKLRKDMDKMEDENTPEYKALLSELETKKELLAAELDEKGMSYQQVYKAEFIVPGVKMASCVGTRAGYVLSDIEKGMVLHGLIKTSQQNIGSYSRIGWGAMNWDVKDGNGETLFTTTCDENYILNKKIEVSPKGKEILKAFEAYLDSLSRDGIFLP